MGRRVADRRGAPAHRLRLDRLRSAQPWFRPDPEAVLCEEQPTDYAPFVQRFQAAVRFEAAG